MQVSIVQTLLSPATNILRIFDGWYRATCTQKKLDNCRRKAPNQLFMMTYTTILSYDGTPQSLILQMEEDALAYVS